MLDKVEKSDNDEESNNAITEDEGLIAVHTACLQMHAIWRPTPSHDLGVDGQIEFLLPGSKVISEGKLLAVQVKSGKSYCENATADNVPYYPKAKHRKYWSSLNLPIILVLHNSADEMTIYANVKEQLKGDGPILVRKADILSKGARDNLISIISRHESGFDAETIVKKLSAIRLSREGPAASFTGIEFLLSCLNFEHLEFELCACRVRAVLRVAQLDGAFTSGQFEEMFAAFVMTCIRYGLTGSIEEEFDKFWYELNTIPHILTTLTSSGTRVLKFIAENADRFINNKLFPAIAGTATGLLVARSIMTVAEAESDRMYRRESLFYEPRGG